MTEILLQSKHHLISWYALEKLLVNKYIVSSLNEFLKNNSDTWCLRARRQGNAHIENNAETEKLFSGTKYDLFQEMPEWKEIFLQNIKQSHKQGIFPHNLYHRYLYQTLLMSL